MDLDEPDRFAAVDPSDALGVTLESWRQWLDASQFSALLPADATALVVVGMGGSGIAGDVLAAVAAERLRIPVVVHKDADLPAFVGPRTAVHAVSYSGGTAEVLEATQRALDVGAQVVAITSGGPLAAKAAAAGRPVLRVPGGLEPRHALGWLASALLASCGLADALAQAGEAQRLVGAACGPGVPTGSNPAKRLAARIASSDLVVAWGAGGVASVAALRLVCQLQEHAKLPAYRVLLPELAHNEVAGWQEADRSVDARGLVVLRDPVGETRAAAARVDPARAQVRHRFAWSEELYSEPGPALARFAGLAMLIDLASVYAAIARDTDPTPVRSIDTVKAATGAFPGYGAARGAEEARR